MILYILLRGDLNLEFKSNLYNYFIKNLEHKYSIVSNKNEIITDNIEKKQVDYIINCYNKNLSNIPRRNYIFLFYYIRIK